MPKLTAALSRPLMAGVGLAMGRPSLLTAELVENIVGRVSAGENMREICAALGLSYDTVNAWLERGRKGRGNRLQEDLAVGVDGARAELELEELEPRRRELQRAVRRWRYRMKKAA